MTNMTAYFTKGRHLIEFDILNENKSKEGKPCYLARIKGTEQLAWIFHDAIEFIIGDWKGTFVIPVIPDIELTIVKEISII